ncbi:MAG: hypothetical protein WDA06_04345 [Phenylobacterium sp.]
MRGGRALGIAAAAHAACLACAAPALGQTLGGGGGDVHVAWWRVVLALAISLGLGLAAALALRARLRGGVASPAAAIAGLFRVGPGPSGPSDQRRLQLVETIRLSHQVDICLLRCGDAEFLVAATPAGAFQLRARPEGAGE